MASGPEHYQAAEDLLKLEQTISAKNIDLRQLTVDKAMVHALLAQVAATAPTSTFNGEKWTRVTR